MSRSIAPTWASAGRIDRFSFGSQNQVDFTWGNRMEIGYMMGDPSGWQAVLWHVNGPNETISNADFDQRFQGVDSQGNPILTQLPTPGAIDSINQLKMSSFELNKVWRLKPYHNGAILEPIIGYRYMNVRDYYRRSTLTEFPGTAGVPPFAIGDEFLQQLQHTSQFINSMHGGQIGRLSPPARPLALVSGSEGVWGGQLPALADRHAKHSAESRPGPYRQNPKTKSTGSAKVATSTADPLLSRDTVLLGRRGSHGCLV